MISGEGWVLESSELGVSSVHTKYTWSHVIGMVGKLVTMIPVGKRCALSVIECVGDSPNIYVS